MRLPEHWEDHEVGDFKHAKYCSSQGAGPADQRLSAAQIILKVQFKTLLFIRSKLFFIQRSKSINTQFGTQKDFDYIKQCFMVTSLY